MATALTISKFYACRVEISIDAISGHRHTSRMMANIKPSRRDLIECLIALSALPTMAFGEGLEEQAAAPQTIGPSSLEFDSLKRPIPSATLTNGYRQALEAGAAPPAAVANMMLYYDRDQKKFINPMKVVPSLDKGNYSLKSRLQAFNYTASRDSVRGMNAQISLNATSEIMSGMEKFAWISKSAAEIFTSNSNDVKEKLSTFKSADPAKPSPTTSIAVTTGQFDLQINAYFQKKTGFWQSLLNAVKNVPGSPLLATLGIPGIALSALDFVGTALDKLVNDEKLTPIWTARPTTFALTKDIKADFNFTPGLWAILDTEKARSTKGLTGCTIDIEYGTYGIRDAQDQPLDANYVVADFSAVKA